MEFFTGVYEHKIDKKGRLFVPKRLQEAIEGNLAEMRFVVTLGLDGCLYLFTKADFREHLAGLRKAAFGTPEYRAVMRGIGALSCEQTLDGQGRLLIPDSLRAKAGLGDAAVVIGAIDHIEIWDAQIYHTQAAPAAEETYLQQAERFLDGAADNPETRGDSFV